MRHRPFIVAALVGLLSLLAGCQTAVEKANSISQSIQAKTATIDAAVTVAVTHSTQADVKIVDAEKHVVSAEQHAKAADTVVQTVIAAPDTPAPTKTALAPVHTELVATEADLGVAEPDLEAAHTETTATTSALLPVHVATANINTNAVAAAQVTATVQTSLDKERNHIVGYKARVWIRNISIGFGCFALIAGIVVFISKTAGFGPVMSVLGDVGGGVLKPVGAFLVSAWNKMVSWAKVVGTWIYHISTLGLGKLADLVNAKKAAAATVAVPAVTAPVETVPPAAPSNAADPSAPVS